MVYHELFETWTQSQATKYHIPPIPGGAIYRVPWSHLCSSNPSIHPGGAACSLLRENILPEMIGHCFVVFCSVVVQCCIGVVEILSVFVCGSDFILTRISELD